MHGAVGHRRVSPPDLGVEDGPVHAPGQRAEQLAGRRFVAGGQLVGSHQIADGRDDAAPGLGVRGQLDRLAGRCDGLVGRVRIGVEARVGQLGLAGGGAKALDAAGLDMIEDDQGNRHDWRRDLRQELIRRQRPDGSWINQNSRWMEGDPSLVTGYALLALSYCRPVAEKQ